MSSESNNLYVISINLRRLIDFERNVETQKNLSLVQCKRGLKEILLDISIPEKCILRVAPTVDDIKAQVGKEKKQFRVKKNMQAKTKVKRKYFLSWSS